eukprot:9597645-Lingulodinium_polyedra.AAC.1
MAGGGRAADRRWQAEVSAGLRRCCVCVVRSATGRRERLRWGCGMRAGCAPGGLRGMLGRG